MTATTGRRGKSPPLLFDWSRFMGDPAGYVAKPNTTFSLFAFRAGGSWRWSITMLGEGNLPTPIHVGTSLPTLIRAKHAAERWYIAHGGKPPTRQAEIWETIIDPDKPADDIPF